jgi:hypothetical protein
MCFIACWSFWRVDCGAGTLSGCLGFLCDVRSSSPVQGGAIDAITALFNRIPSQAEKINVFFVDRVSKRAGIRAKVARSARAFLMFIRGDNCRCLTFGHAEP